MRPKSLEFEEGDILEDQSDKEIIQIVKIYKDVVGRPVDWLIKILRPGIKWTTTKSGDQFWVDPRDVNWVYKKVDKQHPANVLYGKNDE